MTPIHFPLSARDRRAAMRPTRARTESRTSLWLSAPSENVLYCLPCRSSRGGRRDGGCGGTAAYAFVRNYHTVSFNPSNTNSQSSTYPSSPISVHQPLRRRVLQRSVGNGVRHFCFFLYCTNNSPMPSLIAGNEAYLVIRYGVGGEATGE
jgi:hypothetical protein